MKEIFRNTLMIGLVLFTLLNLIEVILGSYNVYKMEKLEDLVMKNLNEVKEVIIKSNEHLSKMQQMDKHE
ncbi:hypothetical protein [Helicobacter cetorum]|uniref:hypothetical protein n=1 Tax=Helicobacter cetorum TaxID=138563 RepID=UPI000CF01D58|nr:hypothetical protein [Helicobacter cetorum]